jgi:hypothetical protein
MPLPSQRNPIHNGPTPQIYTFLHKQINPLGFVCVYILALAAQANNSLKGHNLKVRDRYRRKIPIEMSMKTLLFVLGIAMLVVSAQFGVGESRALRSAMEACKQAGDEADDQSVGMASFVVSAKNSSTSGGPLARSLAFMLASGPSKKGPGH